MLDAADDWPAHPTVFVTTLPEVASALEPRGRVTVVGECTRRNPIKAIVVLARAVKFAWRERPDVVITTGALPLAMVCAASKLLGARIIWIDSFSKTERLSISGKFVRPFADLFLVQWPELAGRHRGVEYAGALV